MSLRHFSDRAFVALLHCTERKDCQRTNHSNTPRDFVLPIIPINPVHSPSHELARCRAIDSSPFNRQMIRQVFRFVITCILGRFHESCHSRDPVCVVRGKATANRMEVSGFFARVIILSQTGAEAGKSRSGASSERARSFSFNRGATPI
jgi:hypothetical protein